MDCHFFVDIGLISFLIITGSSNVSWKDAIVSTIEEAAKTLDNLSNIKILNQYANIKNNKIHEYLVDLELTFFIDKSKNDKENKLATEDNM